MGAIHVHEFVSLDGVMDTPTWTFEFGFDPRMGVAIGAVTARLDDGLVDELHLFVYPLTRGSGPRVFPDGAAPVKLALGASESYDNGVVYLNYRAQAASGSTPR